jgi:Mg2+ and Co2+ transporter CorA
MTIDDKTLAPDALLDRIGVFVAESREMVKSGAMMDIEDLEKKVSELCDMVLSLSQADRLRYADKLQLLLADIGKLGEEMTTLKDAMGDEIKSLSNVKKASVAYRVADSRDGYGKKDDN